MRFDGRRSGRDVKLHDDALEELCHLSGVLRGDNVEARDSALIRGDHVHMYVANAKLLGIELEVDPLAFLPFLRRGPSAFKRRFFILAGDRNEVLVQELDYLAIGERTRPQPEGSSSTPAGIDFSVIG